MSAGSAHFAPLGMPSRAVPFSVRCRYCRHLIATVAYLGERDAVAVRGHLATCYPNPDATPHPSRRGLSRRVLTAAE